jgi:hypothetical protein
MPVITRSQQKKIDEQQNSTEKCSSKLTQNKIQANTRSQKKIASKPKEVPLYLWFIKTIQTYINEVNRLSKLNRDYDDKIRLVTEMFYIVNEHFDDVVESVKTSSNIIRLPNILRLAVPLHDKSCELIGDIIHRNPLALFRRNLCGKKDIIGSKAAIDKVALNELYKANITLSKYTCNQKSELLDFSAENEYYNIYEEEEE